MAPPTVTSLSCSHETLTGRTLVFRRPTGALAAFLDGLRRLVGNVQSEDTFVALLYSSENPLLTPDVVTGRGIVTASSFGNPVYHVMLDLLGRHRVALGRLDLAAAESQHTLSVAAAAAKLGITESQVQTAIQLFELPAWKRGGAYFLTPGAVAAYAYAQSLRAAEPVAAKPSTPVRVRVGVRNGTSLQIAGHSTPLTQDGSGAWNGEIPAGWRSLGVLWKDGANARFFRIEPGGALGRLSNGDLFVMGQFSTVEKVNNPARARAAFEAMQKATAPAPEGQ